MLSAWSRLSLRVSIGSHMRFPDIAKRMRGMSAHHLLSAAVPLLLNIFTNTMLTTTTTVIMPATTLQLQYYYEVVERKKQPKATSQAYDDGLVNHPSSNTQAESLKQQLSMATFISSALRGMSDASIGTTLALTADVFILADRTVGCHALSLVVLPAWKIATTGTANQHEDSRSVPESTR